MSPKHSGLVGLDGKPIPASQPRSRSEPSAIQEDLKLPEPSLTQHVVSLAVSAKAYMGIKSFEEQELGNPHKGLARYHIDMLAILSEKCKGNLSEEEAHILDSQLMELKRLFVQTFRSSPAPSNSNSSNSKAGA